MQSCTQSPQKVGGVIGVGIRADFVFVFGKKRACFGKRDDGAEVDFTAGSDINTGNLRPQFPKVIIRFNFAQIAVTAFNAKKFNAITSVNLVAKGISIHRKVTAVHIFQVLVDECVAGACADVYLRIQPKGGVDK